MEMVIASEMARDTQEDAEERNEEEGIGRKVLSRFIL